VNRERERIKMRLRERWMRGKGLSGEGFVFVHEKVFRSRLYFRAR